MYECGNGEGISFGMSLHRELDECDISRWMRCCKRSSPVAKLGGGTGGSATSQTDKRDGAGAGVV